MADKRSRRNFLTTVAAVGGTSAVLGSQGTADDAPQERTPHGALTDFASQRFERFLNARETQTMNAEIQSNLRAAEAMKSVSLTNASWYWNSAAWPESG